MVNFSISDDCASMLDGCPDLLGGDDLSFTDDTRPTHPQPWCGQHLSNGDCINKNFYNYTDQNDKEKTPMCRIAELARYHKMKYRYKLMDESGPAHKKLFTVQLVMSPDQNKQVIYEGSGASIKKAQQAAALEALSNSSLSVPPEKPVKKRRDAPTAVQLLHQMARKMHVQEPVYRMFPKQRYNNPRMPFGPPMPIMFPRENPTFTLPAVPQAVVTSKMAPKKTRIAPSKGKKATFLSDAGNNIVGGEDAVVVKEKKAEPGTSSIRSDTRTRWCNKILDMKVMAINREFIANKLLKPEKYTTLAYEKNEAKNRYDDILCTDQTRVVLKDRPADDDYIHANWMTMPDGHKYICTQGPVGASLDDFWHMIVTEKSNVIVMLTALEDGPNSKCTRYYPSEKTEEYGPYKVTLKATKEDPFPGIKHMILEAEGNGSSVTVNHFMYATWTDHTAPESATPAIGLFKMVKKLAGSNPITVHCSAGIGRTATFVGIDYASQKIRKEGETYNMVDVIKDLRNQRFHSIQSAVQYLFLHMCILELFVDEGAIPRAGRYEGFLANYAKLLQRFAAKNNQLKKK